MKSVLIIPVNYNSYDSLRDYLFSISESINCLPPKTITVDVMIADNSTTKEFLDISIYNFNKIEIERLENKGYFGGAFCVYNSLDKTEYDYIIISNVDLKLSRHFLKVLSTEDFSSSIGWIAPSIISKHDGQDMNPKIINRYSKRTMRMLRIMYKYPLLKTIYMGTLYKRKKKYTNQAHKREYIYAGHGAMFILTKTFFKRNQSLEYPVFLYGEEIFIGEMVRISGLRTLYCPSLVVYDDAHVSTSSISSRRNRKYNVEALTYLIKTYYE